MREREREGGKDVNKQKTKKKINKKDALRVRMGKGNPFLFVIWGGCCI